MKLCKEINSSSSQPCDLDESLIQELAYTARGDLCPMAAFVGGITAQEVMKVGTVISLGLQKTLYFYFCSLKATLLIWSKKIQAGKTLFILVAYQGQRLSKQEKNKHENF